MSTDNKICIKNFVYWRENSFSHSNMMELEELLCQICVGYSNIYILYMCKSKINRNHLISYLAFKLVIGNLETADH